MTTAIPFDSPLGGVGPTVGSRSRRRRWKRSVERLSVVIAIEAGFRKGTWGDETAKGREP